MRVRRSSPAAVLVALAAVTVTGCGFKGVYSLPLPGAVGTGSGTYVVNVEFADVLDLVPYSAVKVNGATVGHIKTIKLVSGHADVACQLLKSAHLPQNAVARVEETSLLGEKYVELEPPKGVPAVGQLANGATIPLQATNTDASVEEVLGALSALLNGGGVAQINTIAKEVNTALTGRTAVSRDLLSQFRIFASGLNAQKQQIVRAIQGVDQFSRTVKAQENLLVGAIQHLPPALRILADDRRQLTTMLTSVGHLGNVAVRVENASQRDLLANLRGLRPTLGKLAKVGNLIPKTLSILITYPTADTVENEYFGDYGNLSLTIDLSGSSLARLLAGSQLPTTLPAGSHHRRGPGRPGRSTAHTTPDRSGGLASITRWAQGSTIKDLLAGAMR